MAVWRRKPNALTAAAVIVQGPGTPVQKDPRSRPKVARHPDMWQREVWDFYDTLGEFRQGVQWKSNMMSRIRLRAAKITPELDEPEIVDTGPAHDIVRDLAGNVGGQSKLMRSFSTHLSVPGDCWLVGETLNDGNKWYVRSLDEVRPSVTSTGMYEVAITAHDWRLLGNDSLVARVYRPHERWNTVADSPARAARPLLRELELVNRHVAAQYISRLASAGIVIFPEEVTFPVREEFQDAPDPFVAEWIEVAAEAVRTPGTAAAAVPIPMRVPAEYVDKIQHIDFTLQLDSDIISKRDSALARLAIELDMPPEALLGTRDVNHWSAWLIDEQGVKVHIAPDAETICESLTIGYLHPRLNAMGEDPTEWVVWYDASELILRPDRSAAAQEAYDRVELTGEALRRELGFDESDKPNDDDMRDIILKKAALQPVNTFQAMDELGLETSHDTPVTAPRPPGETPDDAPQQDDRTPPNQNDNSPTAQSRLKEQLIHQGKQQHAIHIEFDGWTLQHPYDCVEHLFSCPVTHATWHRVVNAMPGMSGVYRCWLNAYGQPIMGERIFNGDADRMLTSPKRYFTAQVKA